MSGMIVPGVPMRAQCELSSFALRVPVSSDRLAWR